MPRGSGARASVSSSAALRSSYRTTFIDSYAARSSLRSLALLEHVAVRVLGGANLLVEIVEVVERGPCLARPEQFADLVAVERVDGILLLEEERARRREILRVRAVAEELARPDVRDVVDRRRNGVG